MEAEFLHDLVPALEGGRFRQLQPRYFPAEAPVRAWEVLPENYAALLARADPGDVLLLGVLVREHLAPASAASRPIVLDRQTTRPVALRGATFVRLPPTPKVSLPQALEGSGGANAVVHVATAAQTQALLVHAARHPDARFVVLVRDAAGKDAINVLLTLPAVIFVRMAFSIVKTFGGGGGDPAAQARLVWVGDKVLPLASLWAPAARTVFGPDADVGAIAAAHAEYYATGLK